MLFLNASVSVSTAAYFTMPHQLCLQWRTVSSLNCRQICFRTEWSLSVSHLFHSFVLQIQVGNHNWRSPTGSRRFLRSDTGCCCRNVVWQSILGVQENNWSLTYPPSLYHQSSKDSKRSRLFTADTMIISHWLYLPAVLIRDSVFLSSSFTHLV